MLPGLLILLLLLLGCGAAFCLVGGRCVLLPAVCRATCPPDSTRLEISRSDVHSRDMFVAVALLGLGALLTCARRHGQGSGLEYLGRWAASYGP